jgi:hypothetical protein
MGLQERANKRKIIMDKERATEDSFQMNKILIGYDRETQQKIRELHKLDKMSLILHILNIEEFINQSNK